MLKIYGGDLSSPANKVRFVANYIGLDFEYIRVNIREGEHRKEEFLRLNPVGKVPAIDDDGFTMFESDAIVQYLAEKHDSSLYPKDLQKRALVNQWRDFSAIHINGAMGRVVFNRVFYKFAKVEQDQQSLKDGLSFLDRFLPVVDGQLGKTKYLASDELTLTDMTLLSALDPAEVAQVDLSSYQNLTKWRNELHQQDFYTKTHKVYGEILKQMAG